MNMTDKLTIPTAVKERYYMALEELPDDTGYFDHEFVLKFFGKEILDEREKTINECIKILRSYNVCQPANSVQRQLGENQFRLLAFANRAEEDEK